MSNDSQILLKNIQKMFSNNSTAINAEHQWLKKLNNSRGPGKHELELAVAVLLVDLASCDQNFDQQEYEVIVNGLKRMFGTQRHEVRALINEATTVLSGMRGPSRFAEILRETLPPEQKAVIMDIIDQTIAADNKEDGFEAYLRSKFAEMLGIKH